MLTEEQIITIKKAAIATDPGKPWGDSIAFARAIESAVRAELVAASSLTDKQCDEFRRLPGTFNDMVRAIYEAGRASKAAEYAYICRTPEGYRLVKITPDSNDLTNMAVAKKLLPRGDVLHESWFPLLKEQWDAVLSASQESGT